MPVFARSQGPGGGQGGGGGQGRGGRPRRRFSPGTRRILCLSVLWPEGAPSAGSSLPRCQMSPMRDDDDPGEIILRPGRKLPG